MYKNFMLFIIPIFFMSCSQDDFPRTFTYTNLESNSFNYYEVDENLNPDRISEPYGSLEVSESEIEDFLVDYISYAPEWTSLEFTILNESEVQVANRDVTPPVELILTYTKIDDSIFIEDEQFFLVLKNNTIFFPIQLTYGAPADQTTPNTNPKFLGNIDVAISLDPSLIANDIILNNECNPGDSLAVIMVDYIYSEI